MHETSAHCVAIALATYATGTIATVCARVITIVRRQKRDQLKTVSLLKAKYVFISIQKQKQLFPQHIVETTLLTE
jgi:hypothetical protein